MAEAVAEVFSRFSPNGVALESQVSGFKPDGEGIPSGLMRVCVYLPVDKTLEEKRQKLEEAVWYLGRIQPLPSLEYHYLKEADWSEAWKSHYQPVCIGERLAIIPAWLANPFPDRVEVKIDPGMAFGTGTHPSTQLCLEFIEDWYKEGAHQGEDVIDLGCGSGILSVAALKLGAGRALAVDIDPLAVKATQENANVNQVNQRIETGEGSLQEIRDGKYSLRRSPLVLANILAGVILQLLEAGLAKLVTPRGALVLAGILAEQAVDVEAALSRQKMVVVEHRQSEDWVALKAVYATMLEK